MRAAAPATPELARALRIQLRVIGALMLREMQTRFGRDNLGYLWLFLEPMLLGGAIGTLHHLSGHGLPGNLPIMMFWVTGYIPYYMFRGIVNRGPDAVVANQSLLYHRRITLHDIILARNLLEGGAVGGTLAVFMVLFGMLGGTWPAEPALVVIGMVLMLLLSHGFAVMLAAASIFTDLVDRTVHLLTYLSLPFTGAFFMVFWLPTDMQQAVMAVPLVHAFELIRHGLFGTQVPTHYDLTTLLAWVLVTNLAGLLLLGIARKRLVV